MRNGRPWRISGFLLALGLLGVGSVAYGYSYEPAYSDDNPDSAAASQQFAGPNIDTQVSPVTTAAASEPFAKTQLYSQLTTSSRASLDAAALDKLNKLAWKYAGDPDFDYFYGVALLDNGQPQAALFPLIRASQQRPGSLSVKLDLARAYYASNDYASAKVIFNALADGNPPLRFAAVIDKYLKAIEGQTEHNEFRRQLLLAAGIGYDSNANAAPDLSHFAGFTLSQSAQNKKSAYANLFIGGGVSVPVSPRWAWFIDGRLHSWTYFSASDFDLLAASGDTGLKYSRGDSTTRLGLSSGVDLIDGDNNNHYAAVDADWSLRPKGYWGYQLGGQYAAVRYEDALDIRDVNRLIGFAGANRSISFAYGSELGLKLLAGKDDARESGSPFGRDLYGVSLSAASQLNLRSRLNFLLQFLGSNYDGRFFGSHRRDSQVSTRLAWNLTDVRLPGWGLQLAGGYTDNQSNVDIYDFGRFDVSLTVSWHLE